VVLDSTCSTDSLVLHIGSLTVCCHCTVIIVHVLVGFACADWPLLCGCYALTLEVVCVGVMDTCGHLKTGLGGRGSGLWLVGFQKCVEDLVGEDS